MFFYLRCGRGFNCLHIAWTKRCLVSYFLCGDPQNNFGPHKAPRHTENTWTSPFASCPLLNTRDISTSWGCGQASGYCDVCPALHVSGSWVWPSYRFGWSWLVPRPCQYLSDKDETKISVWNFLPTTWW
jgi:hypothetical protein